MDKISHYFDHTLLRPDANKAQIEQLCHAAVNLSVSAVCVQPCWVPLCKELLQDSSVNICTVIGFPLGGDTTLGKAAALDAALNHGCDEFDIMINLGWFKSGNTRYVANEIKELVLMADGKVTKIIIESGLLNDQEISLATKIVADSGSAFIKTSTGFAEIGARTDAIKIIRQSIGDTGLKIKASGGIQTADQVAEFLGLGVERLGTSHTAAILQEFANESKQT